MVSEAIKSKEDVSPGSVATVAASREISIAPDRIEAIAQLLNELFDLAAPLEGSSYDEYEASQPFDPRWTKDASA
jgi:hypothetical protein